MSDTSPDWPAAVTRLRTILPIERLDQSVVSFLQTRRDDPWVLACSGGADSTCLALVACGLFGERSGSLHLAHFNHGLRGEDALADQRFVENLAAGLNLELVVGHAESMPQHPSEAVLRDQRHAFLSDVCAQSGAQVVLLGHHRDDLAETMLMRLTRGSGTEGLAAPRPIHLINDLWRTRPLLSLTRADLQNALLQAEAPWREDASNADLGPFRNRVRLQVLPQLAKVSPSEALAGFGRSRDLLEEDAEALHDWAETAFAQLTKPNGSLDAEALRALPLAVMRRVVRKWLSVGSPSASLSADAFDHLLLEIASGRPCKNSVSRDHWIVADWQTICLVEECLPQRGWGPCSLPATGLLVLPDSGVLRIGDRLDGDEARQVLLEEGLDERREVLLDADSLPGSLWVRTWLPGDRYAPLGAPGRRKLQDMFTDRKIPASLRGRLPVILAEPDEIAWCPGLPPAENCRVTSRSRAVLRLTYDKPKTL